MQQELLDQLYAWVSEFFPCDRERKAVLYILEKTLLIDFWESNQFSQSNNIDYSLLVVNWENKSIRMIASLTDYFSCF